MECFLNFAYPGPSFGLNLSVSVKDICEAGGEDGNTEVILVDQEEQKEDFEKNKIYHYRGAYYSSETIRDGKNPDVWWMYNRKTELWDGYEVGEDSFKGTGNYNLTIPHTFTSLNPHKPVWPE